MFLSYFLNKDMLQPDRSVYEHTHTHTKPRPQRARVDRNAGARHVWKEKWAAMILLFVYISITAAWQHHLL